MTDWLPIYFIDFWLTFPQLSSQSSQSSQNWKRNCEAIWGITVFLETDMDD